MWIKFWRQTWTAPCNTTLVTIICLCKSKWTINASFTYFRNVTLQLVKLYCLKPSKLWRTGDFSLTHSSLSQTVVLFLLSFVWSFFFFFLLNVLFRFTLLYLNLFLPDKSRSVLSSKSYPCIKWFKGTWTGICLSVSSCSFHVSKTKDKKLKVEEKYTPKIYK